MGKALYQDSIFELGTGIASSFSGMELNAFWERALHLYISIYIIFNIQGVPPKSLLTP